MSRITEKPELIAEPNEIKRPTITSRIAPNDRITPSKPFKPACVFVNDANNEPSKTMTNPIPEPINAIFKTFMAFVLPIVALRNNRCVKVSFLTALSCATVWTVVSWVSLDAIFCALDINKIICCNFPIMPDNAPDVSIAPTIDSVKTPVSSIASFTCSL